MRAILPARVMLRCKHCATVRVFTGVAGFAIAGQSDHGVELWLADGHWREDKSPHPMDIVGVYDAVGNVEPLTDQFQRSSPNP